MFFETISISSAELNAGSLQVKHCIDKDPPAYQGQGDYKPTKIYIENVSGKEVKYGLMTNHEYLLCSGNMAAGSGMLYSSLKPIAASITDTMSNIRGEISYVLASGTTGHSGSINFYLVRE